MCFLLARTPPKHESERKRREGGSRVRHHAHTHSSRSVARLAKVPVVAKGKAPAWLHAGAQQKRK